MRTAAQRSMAWWESRQEMTDTSRVTAGVTSLNIAHLAFLAMTQPFNYPRDYQIKHDVGHGHRLLHELVATAAKHCRHFGDALAGESEARDKRGIELNGQQDRGKGDSLYASQVEEATDENEEEMRQQVPYIYIYTQREREPKEKETDMRI